MRLAVSWESYVAFRGLPFTSLKFPGFVIIFLAPCRILTSPFINATISFISSLKVLVSISEAVTRKATNDAQTDNSRNHHIAAKRTTDER